MSDKWTGATPFDPKKHKPIELPGGSSATEYTATIEIDGKFVNVPQIWFQGDTPLFFNSRSGRGLGTLVSSYERGTGKMFPRFDTEEKASEAARKRSAVGGATKSLLAKEK